MLMADFFLSRLKGNQTDHAMGRTISEVESTVGDDKMWRIQSVLVLGSARRDGGECGGVRPRLSARAFSRRLSGAGDATPTHYQRVTCLLAGLLAFKAVSSHFPLR